MGSYGLGMTRILAAGIEVLSLPNEIRWPIALAPFTVCIIPPKVFQFFGNIAHGKYCQWNQYSPIQSHE